MASSIGRFVFQYVHVRAKAPVNPSFFMEAEVPPPKKTVIVRGIYP
jgi:hypothetical protein